MGGPKEECKNVVLTSMRDLEGNDITDRSQWPQIITEYYRSLLGKGPSQEELREDQNRLDVEARAARDLDGALAVSFEVVLHTVSRLKTGSQSGQDNVVN